MSDHAGRRILFNVMATYGRSVYALVVGVFTNRWILNAMGEVDLGLFGVVGGLISIFTVLNCLLAVATARYFAVSLGASAKDSPGSREEPCRWFNAAVTAHFTLAVVTVAIAYPFGRWAVAQWLSIPATRIAVCEQVLIVACASAFVGMVNVPFQAMFTAKQDIAEQSFYSSSQTTIGFFICFYMITHPGDWLLGYAVLLALNTALPEIVVCVRAVIKYPECRIVRGWLFDGGRILAMLRYAGWQAWTGVGYAFCTHGMNLFVNRLFGAAVNASMAINTKVDTQASALTRAMEGAFQPAIAAAWGAGDVVRMRRLAYSSTRYGLAGALLLAVPLLVGLDEILKLWLGHPPPYCSQICSGMLVAFVAGTIGCGEEIAINAVGKIARFQTCMGVAMMLSLGFALVACSCGLGVASVPLAIIASMTLCGVLRLVFGHIVVGMDLRRALFGSVLPVLFLGALSWFVGSGLRFVLPEGLLSTFAGMALGEVAFVALFFLLGVPKDDRQVVAAKARAVVAKLQGGTGVSR